MNDPRPLRTYSQGLEGEVARELEQSRQGYCWPTDKRVATYWRIRGRVAAGKPRHRAWSLAPVLAVAGSALAALALFWLLPARQSPPAADGPAPIERWSDSSAASLGPAAAASQLLISEGLGVVEVSPAASLQLEELAGERQLRIAQATLRAQIAPQRLDRPVVFVTPHLRVVIVGTRFDVRTDARHTTVAVLEGLVRVETAAAALLVAAGESVDSDDPRLQLPRPSAAAPAAVGARPTGPANRLARERPALPALERCTRLPERAREACLRAIAAGDGLAAQNALFSLGLLARDRPDGDGQALALFRQHGHRFPNAALAPEVALRELELLRRLGRLEEATEVAASFGERFPDDPRAPQAALVRASILCARRPGTAEASFLLDVLEKRPEPELRTAAQRLRPRCGAGPGESPEPVEFLGPATPRRAPGD